MIHREADIAILMPPITDLERHTVRYGGLTAELDKLSLQSFYAPGHKSFDALTDSFADPYDIDHDSFAHTASAKVVRDLTMAIDAKPLYSTNLTLVHHPELNRFLADKANLAVAAADFHPATKLLGHEAIAHALDELPGDTLVVKPVTGMMSKGITVGNKAALAGTDYEPGQYLVQEFIDTSAGIPELRIGGMHNIRAISVGGKLLGALSRLGGTGKDILKGDHFGYFIEPEDLPEGMQAAAQKVHDVLAEQPGAGDNIIAIDLMRGRGADGEVRDVICEVNRRPVRISEYSTRDNPDNVDMQGIRVLGKRWDVAEAALLARQLEK